MLFIYWKPSKIPNETCLFNLISANYILLALSVDRLVAVWKPHVYKAKSNPKHAYYTTFVLALFAILCCAPTFVVIGLEGEDCFAGEHANDILPDEVSDYQKEVNVQSKDSRRCFYTTYGFWQTSFERHKTTQHRENVSKINLNTNQNLFIFYSLNALRFFE